jgi:hypothetical protein
MLFRFKEKTSLGLISFLQALGLAFYCGLVATLFWKGNRLFGEDPNYWGPVLFLVIFTTSALVSALLVLGYPFFLFWQKKQTQKAIKLVAYTAIWLLVFILLGLLLAIFF